MTRTARRLWLAGLCLYGLAAQADLAAHLAGERHAGRPWATPAHLAVAFSAGLFWPADVAAGVLLAR